MNITAKFHDLVFRTTFMLDKLPGIVQRARSELHNKTITARDYKEMNDMIDILNPAQLLKQAKALRQIKQAILNKRPLSPYELRSCLAAIESPDNQMAHDFYAMCFAQ